jgi:hypothetical protein
MPDLPEGELERSVMQGYYDSMAEHVGMEEDPSEGWKRR